MKKILYFIGIVVIFGGLFSLWKEIETDSSSTTKSAQKKDISKKVEVLSIKLPRNNYNGYVDYNDFIEINVKNISTEDLGGEGLYFLTHYRNGSILTNYGEFTSNFAPGDIQKLCIRVRGNNELNILTKRTVWEGEAPIKCELSPVQSR